jgi:hypothetical protein
VTAGDRRKAETGDNAGRQATVRGAGRTAEAPRTRE